MKTPCTLSDAELRAVVRELETSATTTLEALALSGARIELKARAHGLLTGDEIPPKLREGAEAIEDAERAETEADEAQGEAEELREENEVLNRQVEDLNFRPAELTKATTTA